ncbi:hypothetical protein [Parendozoicomonas haliclonae]|uniref:Uncharacterized protein n=1 Tax=Parendozoicomonas haliclonae TaxID=1960125 RepID=A0A1X7AG69_9GAMM|nr:hypothetical protein [Parendozoicomonas haliclonae]SMA39182.1 hypothetical protein EHSB41UT_00984 [Parendozoicomonas haliclonae]
MPGNGSQTRFYQKPAPVEFARIFSGEGKNPLRGGASQLRDISHSDGVWKAEVAPSPASRWAGHKVNFLKRMARKLASLLHHDHVADLDSKLHTAYTSTFLNEHGKALSHRTVSPVKDDTDSSEQACELSTPLGFRVAAAMDLAGICEMERRQKSQPGMKHKNSLVDEQVISQMDYLVNLTPQRLAYEFIAAKKSLPTGYLQRVLIPHYMDVLTLEGRYSERGASAALQILLKEKHLETEKDLTFEALMELRNCVEHLNRQHHRQVSSTQGVSHIPKGIPSSAVKAGSVGKVTVVQVLSEGMAPRQEIRDYLISELRRKGESREKSREEVVAALESRGIKPGSMLSLSQFRDICELLSLHHDHSSRQLITDYLGLVSQLKATHRPPSESALNAAQEAGLNGNEVFEVEGSGKKPLIVIQRPNLEPPSEEVSYTCNDDDLWLINEQVERSWVLRMTRDMANSILRKAMRSKTKISVTIASKLAAAAATGAVTGGIGGIVYLGSALLSAPLLIGVDTGFGLAKEWWYSRKVKKYDKSGEPSAADKRKCLYESLGHLVAERTITDGFNAFFNLKNELSGLSKLEGNARTSAADQIKFRRMQVLQQLRSSQLGDKFNDFGRLMTEAVTDISRFEEEFDQQFEELWRPFSGGKKAAISEERRFKIFNEASNRVLFRYKNKVVKEDQREWLKILVTSKKDSSRVSDIQMREAFGNFKALERKELRRHAVASAFNQLMKGSKLAAFHSVKVIGHFVFTNLTWNAGKVVKAGAMFVLKGILPNKVDLIPVPTAAACAYWIVSFIGGQTLERFNNYLNRVRLKKIIQSRQDSDEREKAYDSNLVKLDKEDWRAMRREAVEGVKKLADIMHKLRTEHDELNMALKKLKPSARDRIDDERLIQRAELILRRKYLEHQVQELLSGAVGTYYQETLRGEWLHREMVHDKDLGLA